jgi:C1A family cysteine protease
LSSGVGGCNGGDPEDGFVYATGGIELASSYPYTSGSSGVTGTCTADSSKFVVKTTDYGNVASGASDETNMMYYLASTGPLSVVVDASTWNTYTGGVMSTCGTSLDHAVQAVGVNTDTNGYWKIRNTWGTSWGESGYIRLAYGADTCGVASDSNFCDTAHY